MMAALKQKGVKERRCILTGNSLPVSQMIRFVLGPEGTLVPDLAEKLPGRGCWTVADRAALDTAIASGNLVKQASRAFKTKIAAHAVSAELGEQIECLMARRWLDRLGLERRAGGLLLGHDQVRASLKAGTARLLIEARDTAPAATRRMRALAQGIADLTIVDLFDRDELGLALGRENVVHAALTSAGSAAKLALEAKKLGRFRAGTTFA